MTILSSHGGYLKARVDSYEVIFKQMKVKICTKDACLYHLCEILIFLELDAQIKSYWAQKLKGSLYSMLIEKAISQTNNHLSKLYGKFC